MAGINRDPKLGIALLSELGRVKTKQTGTSSPTGQPKPGSGPGDPSKQNNLTPIVNARSPQGRKFPMPGAPGTPKKPSPKRPPVGKQTPGINPNAPKPQRRQFPKVNIY